MHATPAAFECISPADAFLMHFFAGRTASERLSDGKVHRRADSFYSRNFESRLAVGASCASASPLNMCSRTQEDAKADVHDTAVCAAICSIGGGRDGWRCRHSGPRR